MCGKFGVVKFYLGRLCDCQTGLCLDTFFFAGHHCITNGRLYSEIAGKVSRSSTIPCVNCSLGVAPHSAAFAKRRSESVKIILTANPTRLT